jgi:hypothetical protein
MFVSGTIFFTRTELRRKNPGVNRTEENDTQILSGNSCRHPGSQ